jgi:predicted PurR-regulated permease PerM
MNNRASLRDWQRPLFVLGSTTLVVALLYWARQVLIPVALAILLTFTLGPLVIALQKFRLGRVPAVLVVLLLTTLGVAGFGLAVFHEVQSLAAELPEHKSEIIRKIETIQDLAHGSVTDGLASLVNDVTKALNKTQAAAAEPGTEPVPVKVEEAPAPLAYISSLAGPLLEPLVATLLVIVLTAFMLIRREDLRNRIIRLWSHGGVTRMTRALDDAARRISRYLLMQAILNGTFGVVLGVTLWLIGVPYAFLWGMLAAVLRYVPYLGIWLAAVFPVVLSLAVFPDWVRPALVLGCYVGLDAIISNVLEPRLYGQSVGVSEVALLIAAAFWTWLWGPIGLVLATPLTACLVVLGRHLPQLEFLNVLLGDEPALPTHIAYYQRLLARDEDEATDLIEEYCRSHPVENICDEVLLPALVLAKHNRERGELTRGDERFLLRVTREVVEEVVAPALAAARGEAHREQADTEPPVLVFGCPARDAYDELALHMFQHLVESQRCRFEVLSALTLTTEVLAQVKEERPALVCIAALPPEGLAHTRYLCKRLRRQFADLKILVGCWGVHDDLDKATARLTEAGADFVAGQLRDTRRQVLPLIQVKAAQPKAMRTAQAV